MAFADFESSLVDEADASNVSVGTVLAHKKKDGKIHRVQYATRTMTEAEKNYPTCEREALAIIFAVEKFCVYLLPSVKFRITTNHQAL